MKISGVDIRPGNIIEYEGGIWRAVKTQHTQPGKGGAYMQVELKNLRDGRKLIPPLHGALLKNEQDVGLFEKLAFMMRREQRGG